ncbi:MAG: uroporphyrinogen decarboxylase family protein [bacterium]
MTKKERVRAVIEGKDVDRPPVSFWRHFYEKESSAEGLAEAMLGFQEKFDWDFMKVNPRACYHVQDWGGRFKFIGDPTASPIRLDYPVKSYKDWRKLKVLPPDKGALGEQLQALKLIKKGLREDIFFVETIFNPISVAGDLVKDDDQLVRDIREHPEDVRSALDAIAETFSNFALACLDAGASGIFFATTSFASRNTLKDSEYAEFGRPYDLRLLDAVKDRAELVILHVCSENNMLESLLDYPVHAINWATTESTNPKLDEILKRWPRAVIGGVDYKSSILRKEKALEEARRAREMTGGRRWILGAGCTIPPETPEENLRELRKIVEEF